MLGKSVDGGREWHVAPYQQPALSAALLVHLLDLPLGLPKKIPIETYRSIILPVVLYGCETWSHIAGETQVEGV